MSEETLRRELMELINGLRREFNESLVLRDQMVKTALASNEKRLDGMNEFRQLVNDRDKTFASSSEVELRAAADEGRFRRLEKFQSNLQGRMAIVALGASVVTAVVTAMILRVVLK